MTFGCLVVVSIVALVNGQPVINKDQIYNLVTRWAPLVWFSQKEKYFPLKVETFLENVQVQQRKSSRAFLKTGSNGTESFLVTKQNLDLLLKINKSFLNGGDPHNYSFPTYALVKLCSTGIQDKIPTFQVTYWFFYPFNKGKEMCFLGSVPTFRLNSACLRSKKIVGSHVGDWEHVTLLFRGNRFPVEMYLSVHDNGVYYRYDSSKHLFRVKSLKSTTKVQRPRPPQYVELEDLSHPIIFAAEGSHGLWGSPGHHIYVSTPRLFDSCSPGRKWETWKNLQIYIRDYDKLPDWINFMGRWGNPKQHCFLFGFCMFHDGPSGILNRPDSFNCFK